VAVKEELQRVRVRQKAPGRDRPVARVLAPRQGRGSHSRREYEKAPGATPGAPLYGHNLMPYLRRTILSVAEPALVSTLQK
jgi:hypothetical protein